MRNWWINLSLREKQILAIGGVALILFLFYEIIWSPLVNANNNLRIRIEHNRSTLSWMREANQHMQNLTKISQEKNHLATGSLLSTVQTEVNQSELAPSATQLRQGENDSVQFNLGKINFDQLIVFLTALWEKYTIIVAQITVTPTGTPGEVTAEVMVRG